MANNITFNIIKNRFTKLMAQDIVGVQPNPWPPAGHKFSIRYGFSKDTRVWSKKKYKFSRAKWYIVEFGEKDYDKVRHWCKEQFGPHPKRPDAWSRWDHRYETKIYLRDEDDAILFKLRWTKCS